MRTYRRVRKCEWCGTAIVRRASNEGAAMMVAEAPGDHVEELPALGTANPRHIA